MRNPTTTRRNQRLLAGAFVLCFAGLLGGCSSLPTPSWDPSDMLDFLDTKKRAPGERKPVFPEGVPGITQGVPRDMIRGNAAAADPQVATAAAPPVEPAPPPAKRTTSSGKRAPAQAAAPEVEIAPDDVNVEESTPANPAPPPRRQARTRTTAPEPQQQANPFPTPLPQR